MNVRKYTDHICEECDGAMEYATKYVEYKKPKTEWASRYKEMAEDELKHAEYLNMMLDEWVDSVSWFSADDRELMQHAKAKMAEKMAIVRMMLNV